MNSKIVKTLLDKWNTSPKDYRCQIYGIITPRKHGEFSLVCYAVKETKRHGIQMTEVNRAWSDRPYYQCKNIWKNVWGSTMIEFDERKNRPQESYGWYEGKWGARVKWSDGESWFMKYVKYLNLDALAETKYKYCAYDRYHGEMSLMAYCRLFDKHKEVEILSKGALWEFINGNFLDRLSRDRDFRNYFRSVAKDLIKPDALKTYTITEVVRAYKNGWTLEKAHEVEWARHALKQAPAGVDRLELAKYLKANNIAPFDYFHYAQTVAKAKEDILAFGNTFPKDFHKQERKMQRKIKIAQAKEDAEREAELKRVAERANALLVRMSRKLAWRVGEWSVILPTSRKEFTEEGRAMHNCIGGYFDTCADGKTMCFFVRRNGKRLADVEANPKTGAIRQCRTIYNRTPDEETRKFSELFAKKLAYDLSKKRKAS